MMGGRTARLVTAAALLWAPAARAQVVSWPSAADPQRYKLGGTVVNAVTGEPIARALVQGPQGAVLTDPLGRFEFAGLRRASVLLAARKPGYFNEQELGRRVMRPAFVEIGPETPPVTLKLFPEAVLAGHVKAADGEPLENVMVALLRAEIVNGRKQWQVHGQSATDEDGAYRVGGLRPGQYMIAAEAARSAEAAVEATARRGYPLHWFYPGTPERASAGVIELGAGQRVEADLSVPLVPVFRVTGTVAGLSRSANVSLGLEAASGAASGVPSRLDPASGRFELRAVPAGAYTLRAMSYAPGGQSFAETPLTVAGDVQGVVLTLVTPSTVPVLVRTELTRPEPPHSVRYYAGPAESQQRQYVQMYLRNLDPPYEMRWPRYEGGPDPSMTITDIRPGRYTVEFQPNGPYYVQSAMCGNVNLLREPLVIAGGTQMPPINVVVRDDPGELTVAPTSALPDSGAMVLLLPESAPTQPARMGFLQPPRPPLGPGQTLVRLAPGAATTVLPLPPGDYAVFAFDSLDDLEYADPEVLRKYLPRAVHASVSPDGKASVSVEVIKAGE